jgi:hypothetical protein
MLPPKARSPTRGNGDRAPAKVGFGKRDKLSDSKRSTRRQQLALALWHGSIPEAAESCDQKNNPAGAPKGNKTTFRGRQPRRDVKSRLSFSSHTPRRASWRGSGCTGPAASGNCPSCGQHVASLVTRTEIARARCRDERAHSAALDRYTQSSLFAADKDVTASLANGWRLFIPSRSERDETEKQAGLKTRENEMRMEKFVGNMFLKVDDIKASGPIRKTITKVSEGSFDKPDLTFDDGTVLSSSKPNLQRARACVRDGKRRLAR